MAKPKSAVEPLPLAVCITDLDDGGAERAMFRIVTGLSQLKKTPWTPVVYCLGPEGVLADQLRAAEIQVECFGATSIRQRGAVKWLAGHLKKQKPVALLSFLFHANIISRWAAKRAGVPVVISGHRVAEKQKRWHLWVDRWTRQLAQHHVCVSRGVAEHVRKNLGVPESAVSVIPNGVEIVDPLPDPVDLESAFGIPRGARTILAVGRLHVQKGFSKLLEAFQQVSEESGPVHLLIVGEGPERAALEAAVQRLKLTGRVHLPGRREDVLAIMRACDVLALSSKWEGMANVVLEAMSVGLPVVAFAVEGVLDVIEPGRTGVVVTADDATALAQSLTQVLDDSHLARELSSEAQSYVSQHLKWDTIVREYDQLLRQLIR